MRFTLLLLLSLCNADRSSAEDHPDLAVGVAGLARLGSWIEVRVQSPEVTAVRLADPLGHMVSYPLTREEGDARGLVLAGKSEGRLELVRDNGVVSTRNLSDICRVIPLDRPIWLTDGTSPIAEASVDLVRDRGSRRDAVVGEVPQLGVSDLRIVDVCFLASPPSSELSDALRTWVADGGHLVLSVGRDPAKLAAAIDWIPVRIGEAKTVREFSAVESAVPASRRLRSRRPVRGAALELSSDGRTLISSLQGSLAVRAAYGLGRVTVFALDLTDASLAEWESLGGLGLLLADVPIERQSTAQTRQLTRSGVSEIETQIMAGVDDATAGSRQRPPSWTILGLLMGYAMVVGLADFVLVRYLLRRPQLTWLTMPLWVIGAFFVADRLDTSGGAESEAIRTATVVDIDAVSGRTRGRRWHSVRGKGLGRLDIVPEAPRDATQWLLGWAAPPESNFGGLYRSDRGSLRTLQYASDDSRHELTGVPFEPGGSRLFRSEWTGQTGELLSGKIFPRGGRLSGTLRSSFRVPVEEWALGYQGALVVPIGGRPLVPGEDFELAAGVVQQATLREGITGFRLAALENEDEDATNKRYVTERDEYDQSSRDLTRVLRTATFFTAAGGESFAGLRASSPRGIEMTELLELDRAVLVGRLQRQEGDSGPTYVRVLLPVGPAMRNPAIDLIEAGDF